MGRDAAFAGPSMRAGAAAARRRYKRPVAKLFLVFTVVPLVELWILLAIGGLIGFWPTVGIAAITAVLGAALAKREGRRVLGGWRDALAIGSVPEEGVTSGVLVLLGAALLITPGVLTDLVGLALLFPPTRRPIAGLVRRWFERRVLSAGRDAASAGAASGFHVRVVHFDGVAAGPPPPYADGVKLIEGAADPADMDEEEVEAAPSQGSQERI